MKYFCIECNSEQALNRQGNALVCSACGAKFGIEGTKIFFTHSPSDVAVNKNTRPDDQSRWSPLRRAQYAFLQRVLDDIDLQSMVCDIGAGPGQFHQILERFSHRLAIDFFPYPEVNLVVDLERRLPFSPSSFDVLVSMNTFEHIHNVRALIKECHRILKKGGVLAGSTPFLLGIHQAPYDFHRFTPFELEKLFIEEGFRVVKIKPLGSALDWYQLSQRHFFQKLFDAVETKIIPFQVAVKIIWNIQKMITFVCSPLYRLNKDTADCLGYGFVVSKI